MEKKYHKKEDGNKKDNKMKENIAIILFSVAMTCLAAFALFVPLVIIPSIQEMAVTYDFDHTPVLCVTVEFALKEDASECNDWSFCKQTCEAQPTSCHQVLINYRKFNNSLKAPEEIPEHEWQNKSLWDETYTKLLVNAKGCGNAPEVRCNEFGETIQKIGKAYGCHYSRRNPRLVVLNDQWTIPTSSLMITLGLPVTLLSTSLTIFALLGAQKCVPSSERLKPEGITTQQGRYSSIQDVNSTRT